MFTKRRFHKRSVSVEERLLDAKGKLIEVDPVQIREVFNNILNNAYQAIQDKKGKICIGAEFDKQGFIRISFKDNGVGIDEQHLNRIFEPFYTTKSKGTGLGLTICKDLVELHGGRLYIETEIGKGTTVTVKLPVKKRAL